MKEETGSAGHADTRRLAAIMFTDIVGFSRQMGSDEAPMLRQCTGLTPCERWDSNKLRMKNEELKMMKNECGMLNEEWGMREMETHELAHSLMHRCACHWRGS